MIIHENPSIKWKYLFPSILLIGSFYCKKPNAAQEVTTRPDAIDYEQLLKEHTWGFTKGEAPPHAEFTINFRYANLELHDGPVNYSLSAKEIKCVSDTCQIMSGGKKIFALKFIKTDVIEIISPWEMEKSTESMHESGGVVLRVGDKFKPLKIE